MSAHRHGPARIEPGRLKDLGPLIWGFSRIAGRVTGTEPPAVFTTLGRGRGTFWGWLHFAGSMMPGGKLPRRETELVILRVAHLRDCAYELSHHERLGRRAGITDQEIARICSADPATGWKAHEALLLAVTDELIADRDLSDHTWDALRDTYDERTCLEVLLLIGHYDMLATTLKTLRVSPDAKRG